MAYVNSTGSVSEGAGFRFAGIVKSVKDALARRRVFSQTRFELNCLSDRDLADLGMSRTNINVVAHKAAYGK